MIHRTLETVAIFVIVCAILGYFIAKLRPDDECPNCGVADNKLHKPGYFTCQCGCIWYPR